MILQILKLFYNMHPLSNRQIALNILLEVFEKHHSLDQAITRFTAESTESSSWIKALCFGLIRKISLLESLMIHLTKKPLSKKDLKLKLILYIGFYQLLFMETKTHAAIFETVELAKRNHLHHASGFVNAVLQIVARQGQTILENIPKEARYNHPEWLLKLIRKAYPQEWQYIIEENNAHPPLFLRVNTQKIERDRYCALLEGRHPYTKPALSKVSIELLEPIDVRTLPHFAEGFVSVQDLAAQQAASLLELEPGQIVLDACAAPGGKTSHILETQSVRLYALDQDAKRMERVQENLSRLGLHAELRVTDASTLEFKSNSFDRILLDAPCSGSGVIRRHPDIRFLRKAEDILSLSQMQQKLLTHLWPMLKPGGILLYATCSILPEENDEVITTFLSKNPDAKASPLQFESGKVTRHGWQFLPQTHGPDGFYYAKLLKS